MKKLVLSLLLGMLIINPVFAEEVCKNGKCLNVVCVEDVLCMFEGVSENKLYTMIINMSNSKYVATICNPDKTSCSDGEKGTLSDEDLEMYKRLAKQANEL